MNGNTRKAPESVAVGSEQDPPAKRAKRAAEPAPGACHGGDDRVPEGDARSQAGEVQLLLAEITTYANTQPLGLKVLIERYHYFLCTLAPSCAESLVSIEESIARLKANGEQAVAYHRSDNFLTDWAFLVSPTARRVTRKRPPSDLALVKGMTGQAIRTKLASYANRLARRAAGNAETEVPPPSPSAHKFAGQRLDPRGTGEAAAKREKASQSIKARVRTLQMGRLDAESLERLRARSAHAAQALADSFGRGRESVWSFIPLEENPYVVFAAGGDGPMVPRRSPKMMKSLSDGDGVKAASNSLIPKAKPKSKQKGAAKGKAAKAAKAPPRGKGQVAEQKAAQKPVRTRNSCLLRFALLCA
jgi:hypothetical protein